MWDDLHLLASIIENTPLTIIVTEAGGRIRYVNKHAETVLKTERSKLLGSALDEHLSHNGAGLHWEEIRERLSRRDECETDALLTCGDGSERFSKLNAFGIQGNGRLNALVFMFTDETEDRKKADQIEKKNLEMARMNSELIRSNAELRKLSELKSSFLSIASHELKTPLTSIKGYSDIIMDGMRDKLDPDVYRMVENINRAADRLHKVVNNILDVTRMEQKRLRLQPEYVALPAVVNETIEELSSIHTSRHISFDCVFGATMPQFYGDKSRMHQVFANIFSNAVKFSPDNSTVDVAVKVEDPGRFHIIVKDHGIGIDKIDQKKIFDPFYEVGSANRHSTHATRFMGGGSGLGLSIVKGIVEVHGGRVWVESPGVSKETFPGSEFHILLPLKAAISPEDEDTEPILLMDDQDTGEIEESVSTVDKKPEILFIDGDKEAAEIARMVLESAFDMLIAETGEQGLLLAFDRRPSLILLDLHLPGLDGFRICRILRSQEETRDIPIAFFSTATDDEEIQRCFACGADDFIVKPFSGKELVDKIWRVLMKKKEDATFK